MEFLRKYISLGVSLCRVWVELLDQADVLTANQILAAVGVQLQGSETGCVKLRILLFWIEETRREISNDGGKIRRKFAADDNS